MPTGPAVDSAVGSRSLHYTEALQALGGVAGSRVEASHHAAET